MSGRTLDVTIIVSKHCPTIDEHVVTIFVTKQVTIGTVLLAKNTLNYSFRGFKFKNGKVNFFLYSQNLISMVRRNRLAKFKKNSVSNVQSHLKFSKT